jgi:hypothetical protein
LVVLDCAQAKQMVVSFDGVHIEAGRGLGKHHLADPPRNHLLVEDPLDGELLVRSPLVLLAAGDHRAHLARLALALPAHLLSCHPPLAHDAFRTAARVAIVEERASHGRAGGRDGSDRNPQYISKECVIQCSSVQFYIFILRFILQ